jgi:hypothetical protein
MQKDVIYIDVDDDITAIIGKVKASEHKIVALVPPKRIGAIQSAVNLKLVLRAATSAGKRLVLITNNAALTALAGSASIPVAKNLQSRPEVAEIPALEVDDGDDIIDGSKIKDGTKSTSDDTDEVVDAISAEETDADNTIVASAPKRSREALGAAAVKKSKIKIPDFDTFRKRLFLIIGGVILVTGFLVWALVFAPSAKITITARTSDSQLNTQVTLADTLTTSLTEGKIKTVTKTTKKTVSIPFTATGKKDVGEKATGTVKIVPGSSIPPIILDDGQAVVPAGTIITSSSGATYATNQQLVFTAGNWSTTRYGQSVGVTATSSGSSYNGASGNATGPSGYTTSFTTTTSGGTDKTITVVQQGDVDAVSSGVGTSSDSDAAKASLKEAFGDDYVIIAESFKQDTGAVKPSPAVDAEATDGKGALAGDVVYTMSAVAKTELTKFLDAYFAQQIDGMTNQKVYSNGLSGVAFSNFARGDSSMTATISATGKYGPKIDIADVKANAKGKRFGEIQSYVKEIPGVDGVDIKLSPFWVTAAPNDVNKIQVEFKVNGA